MAEGDKGGVESATGKIKEGFQDIMSQMTEKLQMNINAGAIADIIIDVDEKAAAIAKSFGQGREQIYNIKVGLTDAVVEVAKLGGKFEDIVNIQESVGKDLGRNIVLASSEYSKLYALQQVVGEQASDMVARLKDVGVSTYQATKETEKIINRAREIGVNAQAVASQVAQNMSLMNKFTFQGGVDGLAKMAAQAVNLRINANAISGAMDKAFDPDSAIDMAASLQRLGVAQSDLLDPLRLMDLAQNDPAELQNQIAEMSKQFVQLNEKGQFEIMPGAKRQMQEIATAMGMSANDLAKMAIGSADLDRKMSKIKFPDTFTEEQKTMIANMAEMGEGGEYKMMLDGKEMGLEDAMQTISSMSTEEQKKFFEQQEPKTMEDLAKEQLSVSKSIDAAMQSLVKTPYALAAGKGTDIALSKTKKGSEDIADVLDNNMTKMSKMREELDKATMGVVESFKKGGEVDFTKLTESMTGFGKYIDGALMTTFEEAGKKMEGAFKFLGGIGVNSPTTTTTTTAPVSSHVAKDSLKLPGKEIQFLPEDSFISMTKGPEFLKTLDMMNKPASGTGGVVNENKNTHDITLTVKIDGGNLSEDKIMAVLNKTETLQSLNKKLKETISNNGLTV